MTNKVETANTNSSLKEQPFYLGRVVLLNLLLKLSLFGTDHSIHFLPFLQQQKRRHCLHSKFLCHLRQLVDVDLGEVNVGELGGHGVDGRLYEPAGSAPRRREIDHQQLGRFLEGIEVKLPSGG